MNAANILKPALSRGEIQVIGATTFNEYRKHIEKDTALERRFQPVTVSEPNVEDTLKILQGIATTMSSSTVCPSRRGCCARRCCCPSAISRTAICRIRLST